jgi:hypothetical protein
MTMTEINSELLRALTIAQLQHAHSFTDAEGIDHALHSDDAFDYLKGALGLARELLVMQFDDDVVALRRLLDPTDEEFAFSNFASDGICGAVYEAFPADWEDQWDRDLPPLPPSAA